MSMQYITYTHNLQNITETDHEKEYKQSNSAIVQWNECKYKSDLDNNITQAL